MSTRKVFIVPCTQDRKKQRDVFLRVLKEREPPSTVFYIVEQDMRDPFDRGMCLNVGFTASKAHQLDVVVLHDVDIIPVEAYPDGYPAPSNGNELLHLYGHVQSCGGIVVTTAQCFRRLGGLDSNPMWGGEDTALQTRAHTFGVKVNKTKRVERFQGNSFIELNLQGEAVPNPQAHREWEREIFVNRKLKKLSRFRPDVRAPGSLFSRHKGVHVFECVPLEERVYICRVRIEKIV